MNAYDRLPDGAGELFGDGATAERTYDLLTVDVPAASWTGALETARDELRCTYFDWLSAVDEPATGFLVCAHVVALEGGRVRRLLLRTTVPHDAPALPSAVGVYAGAAWHERETYEMFGVTFTGHPHLVPLLLPEGFEGHPLRKDFVLAARVAKAWPGAKEPGESEHGGPKRRQMLPPGVPDPNDWGPLKGQLPPAPARPARAARAAGDRPVRRARTAGEGSASQQAPEATAPQAAGPRRARSASEGSASQAAAPATPAGRPAEPTPDTPQTPPRRPRSADAPWNNPRPAFDDAPAPAPEPPAPAPEPPAPAPAEPATAPEPAERAEPAPAPEPPAAPASAPKTPAPAPEPPAAPAPQPGPPGPEDADGRPADGAQPAAGDRAGEERDAAAAPEPEGSGPRPADRSTDTGTTNTEPAETGSTDTDTDPGSADSGPTDTGPTDTGPAHTEPADTGPADPGPADNRRTNTGGDA
ncbi:NADH-quinone oxidoreductase subunit C [Streptomyces lavendulocolor]|uniref:NADH-quinone oxidoreductase subunit C n=1 Tax=Streptomyces lavendulocolor TaxID=67316 RepID=UPI003C2E8FA0